MEDVFESMVFLGVDIAKEGVFTPRSRAIVTSESCRAGGQGFVEYDIRCRSGQESRANRGFISIGMDF